MNIIHPDIDSIIINNCHLVESLPQLACVNSWFSTMIKNNVLYQEYKIGRNKKFDEVCGLGLISYAKWLINNQEINIHAGDECAFNLSCESGYKFNQTMIEAKLILEAFKSLNRISIDCKFKHIVSEAS